MGRTCRAHASRHCLHLHPDLHPNARLEAAAGPQEAAGEAARQATDRHRPQDHTDEDGALLLGTCSRMGLEGIVSKRLSAPYRSGPSRDWIKVKNPNSPAMIRAREAEW